MIARRQIELILTRHQDFKLFSLTLCARRAYGTLDEHKYTLLTFIVHAYTVSTFALVLVHASYSQLAIARTTALQRRASKSCII